MFECSLIQGEIFRKVIGSISELVKDGNFQCNSDGISLQGMDSSHVSLVSLQLRKDGFDTYRNDRDLTMGINIENLSKILKCMGSKDKLSIRSEDESDFALFVFESENEKRLSNFELKLMEIDSEQLGIPETEYKAIIKLPSFEFQRICKDLSQIGDSVTISVNKEGIKFSVSGDIGNGDMTLRQDDNNNNTTKGEINSDSKETEDNNNNNNSNIMIELEEPVSQTFALRYLNSFTKATPLSKTVTLSLGPDVPLVTEYKMNDLGFVRYYLAPKIDDEEE
jgi:proliferating cell nuclear antigen